MIYHGRMLHLKSRSRPVEFLLVLIPFDGVEVLPWKYHLRWWKKIIMKMTIVVMINLDLEKLSGKHVLYLPSCSHIPASVTHQPGHFLWWIIISWPLKIVIIVMLTRCKIDGQEYYQWMAGHSDFSKLDGGLSLGKKLEEEKKKRPGGDNKEEVDNKDHWWLHFSVFSQRILL